MEATTPAYHSAEQHAVGDTRGLLRRRFPVGAASQHQPASRDRGHSVCPACWLPLAHAAVGVSALADYVWLLPILARPGQLEAHSPLPITPTYAGGTAPVQAPPVPWVAIADTQSVSLGCLTHWAGGFDGGKRVKGRKRHVLVDSMGLFLAVVVTVAKLTSKGCRRCCAGSSSGEAGSIGCGSSGATGPMGETCCSSGSWNTSTACWKCWSVPEAMVSD